MSLQPNPLTRLVSLVFLLYLAACGGGGGGGAKAAPTGTALVQVSTTGAPPVANYRLTVDGVARDIGVNASVPIALEEGDHSLVLGGLPTGASVPGGLSRVATIVRGQTFVLTFGVNYTAPIITGELQVTTSATGLVGATSFDLTLDGVFVDAMGKNDSILLADVAAGVHTLALNGVPAAVTVAGGTSRAVSVAANATTQVDFVLTGPVVGVSFLHTTSLGSNNLAKTYIHHPNLDNHPEAVVLVTPNWNPPGHNNNYHRHSIGVFYEAAFGSWAIANEDDAAMAVGTTFNVFVANPATTTFQHISSTNVGNVTLLSHPDLDGVPSAVVFCNHIQNPTGGVWQNNDAPLGVSFLAVQWGIFNQGLQAMPSGNGFGVVVAGAGWNAYAHTATAANIVGSGTVLTHPLLDGHPDALVTATQRYHPAGGAGVLNNKNIGVWYDGTHWQVFNQDETAMPVGCGFNILVGDGSGG